MTIYEMAALVVGTAELLDVQDQDAYEFAIQLATLIHEGLVADVTEDGLQHLQDFMDEHV